MEPRLTEEIRVHDAALEERRLQIWIGAEPTFTDPRSLDPWWLGEPEGGDKEARARALLLALATSLGGSARLLRVQGRSYPGEDRPRFCLGALFDRYEPPGSSPPRVELEAEPIAAPAPGPSEAWLTVTPDPGVVEVNSAPAHDLATFAHWCEATYSAAQAAGLSPSRFRFNGEATDSGGGGQITLGGPSAEHSPFFSHPQLLPRLVRYLNRHPALSYAFAPDCVGSASQGPRADEGARERFDELPVALDWLAGRGALVTPDELWSTLAPLLVDLAGNSHRAELNVEKLWNPYLPGRGRMGVVELRALRMPPTPDRLVALAALFRAIAARLAVSPFEEPLLDWGPRLHGEWALPFFQREDLESVLLDLEAHGVGLGPLLRAEILRGPEPWAEVSLGNSTLELTPALSFWPLFGDVASQESAGSRFVDSSSSRLQLLVRSEDGQAPGTVSAHGWHVPLRTLPGGRQAIGILTWRAFAPRPGLHPGVPPCDPLVLEWTAPQGHQRIALHGWNPLSGAYDGLPLDAAEARRRRLARVVISPLAAPTPAHTSEAGGFGLDLRAPSAPPPKLPA